MAESLCALFEGYKPLKPEFKSVSEVKATVSVTHTTEVAKDEPGQAQRPRSRKPRKKTDPRESRTVFVGNIPTSYSRRKIKQLFKDCGAVESVRLRSIAVSPGDLPTHVARRMFKQVGGNSLNAYVVMSQEDEAEKCLSLNGTLVAGRHIRVDLATKPKAETQKGSNCVFLGNLPFTVDEEQLREAFESCGEIESVRVVRDSRTNIGKGFGFVKFKDRSGVVFALKQNRKVEIGGRPVRVFKNKDMDTVKDVRSRGGEATMPRFAGLQAGKPTMKRASHGKKRDGGSEGRGARVKGNLKFREGRGGGARGKGGRLRQKGQQPRQKQRTKIK